MPSLGADMKAGTLVQWLIKPGDPVQRGQIVAEVETEKGVVEVEIFEDGVVDRLLVAPPTKVPVGTALATIRGSATETTPVASSPVVAAAAPPERTPPPPEMEAVPVEAGGRKRISPLARKRAADLGVDPATLEGSGPGGAVTKSDVERAIKGGQGSLRSAAMRKAIGAAMSRSKREIPHYYLATEIDVGRMIQWLARKNEGTPIAARILPAAALLRAVALALRDAPSLNGVYREDQFVPNPAVHLGVAIALRRGGLVAPAIHDADRKSVAEIMTALGNLIGRVRAGTIRSSELSDPTVTVTNLGDQGVPQVFGVIFPPQVAIVGLGKIVDRPWAVDGLIGIRPVLTATLAGDHRVSDGHEGARFLATLDRLLQSPEVL